MSGQAFTSIPLLPFMTIEIEIQRLACISSLTTMNTIANKSFDKGSGRENSWKPQGRRMALDPFFLLTLFLLVLSFLAQALLLVWMDIF
ncbi:MAG: hypothetical protein WD490_09235 [Opitutales bacterium]